MFFFLASISEKLSEDSVLMVPEETGEKLVFHLLGCSFGEEARNLPLNALLLYDAQLLMEPCLELLIAKTCIPETQFLILEDVPKSKFRTKI